jgi:hypothetical protein
MVAVGRLVVVPTTSLTNAQREAIGIFTVYCLLPHSSSNQLAALTSPAGISRGARNGDIRLIF